eukprot:c36212_g1_i1 orf=24-245(-)
MLKKPSGPAVPYFPSHMHIFIGWHSNLKSYNGILCSFRAQHHSSTARVRNLRVENGRSDDEFHLKRSKPYHKT